MHIIDAVFWWTGAAISMAACTLAACAALYLAHEAVKKVCQLWWDRTLTIYRLESVRYYFRVMIENGRTGLLKEVEKSRQEKEQRGAGDD